MVEILPPFLRSGHETSCAFQFPTDPETSRLIQHLPDDLQAKRKTISRQARRHGNPRQTGEVRRHGEDVVEIHFHRIAALFAKGKRRRRASRRQDRIAAFECLDKSFRIFVRTFWARR